MDTKMMIAALAVGVGLLTSGAASAAEAPPPKVCTAADRWFECAKKVESAITATKDPKVALAAGAEWADVYDKLYKANAQKTWPWSDQEMLEKAIEKLYEEALGKYLDPASLAFGLALAKYLPRLAAALDLAGSAAVSGFVVLLAPSPIANDFTAAGPNNKRINAMLLSKLPQSTQSAIKIRYPDLFNKAYIEVQKAKKATSKP